eukprot:311432_1
MDGKVVPFKSYMVFQFNDPMKSTEISINGSDIKRVRSSRVCQCIFCIRRIIATYKEKEFSILPNGEDENCVFDALALRGTGPPGLYLYDKKNNTITAIQTVKDVAKYKENKISTIKSWAKATDTATNTTAEAIDVDINMMRTTIEPINGTKTIEDAHKQEQLSLNGAANAMNTVTSDNKESKDAKAHGNDLEPQEPQPQDEVGDTFEGDSGTYPPLQNDTEDMFRFGGVGVDEFDDPFRYQRMWVMSNTQNTANGRCLSNGLSVNNLTLCSALSARASITQPSQTAVAAPQVSNSLIEHRNDRSGALLNNANVRSG